MGKIEEAIKKINADIQANPENKFLEAVGEYVIDQIKTEAAAEAVLEEGKSLKKICEEIKDKAYKEALEIHKRSKGRNYEVICYGPEKTIDEVMEYFGLEAAEQKPHLELVKPQTSSEAPKEDPKKSNHLSLDDFF